MLELTRVRSYSFLTSCIEIKRGKHKIGSFYRFSFYTLQKNGTTHLTLKSLSLQQYLWGVVNNLDFPIYLNSAPTELLSSVWTDIKVERNML
jgi:hypothetical protein